MHAIDEFISMKVCACMPYTSSCCHDEPTLMSVNQRTGHIVKQLVKQKRIVIVTPYRALAASVGEISAKSEITCAMHPCYLYPAGRKYRAYYAKVLDKLDNALFTN